MSDMKNSYFNGLLEHNSKILAQFSPNGHAIATAVQSQLHIWNTTKVEISHRFECENLIDFIKWSPDSELICCGSLKHCIIQIFSLDISHWRCKINGSLTFAEINWSPDSRHILVTSEFHIKITVFSLTSAVVTEIEYPKAIENGLIFTPCENYLIVALRMNLEDNIGIYSCDTWEPIKVFPVEMKDMVSITYSSTNFMIAILETALEYKVLFYSIDGRLLGKYIGEVEFGLLSLSWSPSANIVAVGDHLGQVKIIDPFNCELLTSYQQLDIIESKDIVVYKATERSPPSSSTSSPVISSCFLELDEVVKSRPVTLLPASPDSEKAKNKNPLKFGVQSLQFSSDGKYIATITGHMPKVVFIYSVKNSKLSDVILRRSNIKCISWHPEKPQLLICSSPNMLDIWTPNSCTRYITPFIKDFSVYHAAWNLSKNCIILNSRNHYTVLHL